MLKNEAEKLDFLSICTPFDEKSVDLIEELNFQGIKIASCSIPDWPLLERIAKTDKPVIASTAGVSLDNIDQVVSFFENRKRPLVLMHCVGQYPTPIDKLNLDRIDLLRTRYPGVGIGFSTHEEPTNFEAVQMAVAKGVGIFEKHVGIGELNKYSVSPEQMLKWLTALQRAFRMRGSGKNMFGNQELKDLRQFKRGAFASKDIKKDEQIKDIFLAFPNQENQVLANDISKYTSFYANKDIKKNEPIIDVNKVSVRKEINSIVSRANDILKYNKIPVPAGKTDICISYHQGLDKFFETGAVLITCINREYCKKLIVMFRGQGLPHHYHKKKEETFHFLAGDWSIELDGKKKFYKSGDILTVKRGIGHIIKAETDGVLEEISSTHYKDDSYYRDKIIKDRHTYLTYWLK